MRRAALLVLGLASWALAGDPGPLAPPTHAERRELTVIASVGTLPPGAPSQLLARLRRGDRTACQAPLVAEEGQARVELLVRGRLLPGTYALEVAPADGGAALLSAPLAIGTPAEATAAEARHRAWLVAAAGSLRGLSAALERRGRFHHAPASTATPTSAAAHADRLELFLAESLRPGLRAAWLDLSTFRRRIVLAPAPEAGDALRALLPLLEARAAAWEGTLADLRSGRPRPLAADPALEQAIRALVAALWPGEDPGPRLAAWGAGALGEPAPRPGLGLSSGGRHADPLGWRLELPPGFAVEEQVRPDERLRLVGPGCKVVVSVSELPDARDPAALAAALETQNWESFTSYKRLGSEPLPEGGLRIELEADFRGLPSRVVQRSLFPPGGGRAISLLVAWPPDAPAPACLAALEAGFGLGGP